MSKNPLILEPLVSNNIRCTLGNATFVLEAMQHSLYSEGEPIYLTWDAAQGHMFNLRTVINALNTVTTQVELKRKATAALKETGK